MVPWHIHDFLMNDTSRRRRFMKCKTVSDDGFKEPFFGVKKEGFKLSHSMTAIKYDSWGFSDRREMSWKKFIFNGYRRRILWPQVKEKWRCIYLWSESIGVIHWWKQRDMNQHRIFQLETNCCCSQLNHFHFLRNVCSMQETNIPPIKLVIYRLNSKNYFAMNNL